MSPDTQPLSTASHRSRPLGSGCPGPSPWKDGRSRPCPCPSTSPISATSCSGPAGQGRPPGSTPSSRAIDRVQRASGVNTDLELALFRIDHGRGLAAATSQALAAYRARPSIDAADVVAWGLARSGRCVEAQALLEARAPPGHGGLPEVLPPRDDRALPRQRRRREALAAARARPQSCVFSTVVAGSGEARTMKRLPLLARCSRSARRAGDRIRTPARQLHDQPLELARRVGRPRVRALRPRHGGDPHAPERGRIDVDGRSSRKLVLTVDGKARRRSGASSPAPASRRRGPAAYRRRGSRSCSPGRASTDASSLVLRDETYAGRLGWKEVVVSAAGGARIASSTAPAVSPSRQLRAYPKDGLSSPLAVTRARARRRARRRAWHAAAAHVDLWQRSTARDSSRSSRETSARPASSWHSPSRSSGAPPTRSAPATASRSSPRTSSASAAPCATPHTSAASSPLPTRPASSRWARSRCCSPSSSFPRTCTRGSTSSRG